MSNRATKPKEGWTAAHGADRKWGQVAARLSNQQIYMHAGEK